jgi:hypothetical protein
MATANARERELRAKYFDWCSARLADRFLALSPDEIYEMAERASHGRAPEARAAAVSAASHSGESSAYDEADAERGVRADWLEPDSFRVLVARVAEVLADTLPSFEEWAVTYQEDPARFDDEMLGFWKENT